MAKDQQQDIELGITRLEYGDSGRPQRAVLQIQTGKYYNGGVVSDASVFWVGQHSRQRLVSFGGPEGDFTMNRMRLNREVKATQKAIDRQHAEVFTPEVIAQLAEGAKAHYAKYLAEGIDPYKNVYLAEVSK